MREALAFLTILPVGAETKAPGRRALLAFPVVGVVVGSVWAALGWGASAVWAPPVAAALILVADLMLTGGLHLDAVADLADGIASRKETHEAMEVMRDPRIGAVGAATLVIIVLVRFSFILLLCSQEAWRLLVIAPIAGRVSMVWTLHRGGDVRSGSLAFDLARSATMPVVLAVGLGGIGAGAVLGDGRGFFGMAAALLAAEFFCGQTRRRFGVLAGDVIGAVGISSEVVALAVLAALI